MLKLAQEIAEAFDTLLASGHVNERVDQHWARLFQTSEDGPDLILAVSALQMKMRLLQRAVQNSDQSDRAKSLYMNAIGQLEVFVNGFRIQQHNVNQVQQLRQQVDILHLAADSLDGDLIPDVNDLTIEALAAEISDLIKEILDSSLPEDIRVLVVPALETLLMAVRSYRVLGAEGISRIYGAAAAELARVSVKCAKSPPEAKSKIRKALDVAKKAGAAVVWSGAVVSAASGLLEDGSNLLGLTDHTESVEVLGMPD